MRQHLGTQAGAILLDAYRELNARKMFWIVMALSLLVMAAFATLGITHNGLMFLWIPLEVRAPEGAQLLYKILFSYVVIGFYLTWVATILALISTAGIFPDFLTGGAIDLYLSKPIGRGRLFIIKYLSGLLFVTLQVSVFAGASFLVLGLRGHTWEPSLFMAIPIVVLFFSYLYGICVLLGVLTRSTIAALMLTLLAWFLIWGLDQVDKIATSSLDNGSPQKQMEVRQRESLDYEIAAIEKKQAAEPAGDAASTRARSDAAELEQFRQERSALSREIERENPPDWLAVAQKIVVGIKTFVPKTRETLALLDRMLLPDWQIEKAMSEGNGKPMDHLDPTRGRNPWWIIGTSLAFEAVCVGLAAWIFQRRDY